MKRSAQEKRVEQPNPTRPIPNRPQTQPKPTPTQEIPENESEVNPFDVLSYESSLALEKSTKESWERTIQNLEETKFKIIAVKGEDKQPTFAHPLRGFF